MGPILLGLATGAMVLSVGAIATPTEELPAGSLSASLTETANQTARGATTDEDAAPVDGAAPAGVPPEGTEPATSAPAAVPIETGASPQAGGAADLGSGRDTISARPSTTSSGARSSGDDRSGTTSSGGSAGDRTTDSSAQEDDAVVSSGSGASGVVSATNAERKDAGCKALKTDSRLTKSAQGHASDMAKKGYFSHTGKDGRDFADRAEDAGYSSPGGENIAQGQETSAEVLKDWMNSSGHRKNILNCSFTTIGVGYAADGDYWVQVFGR